MPMASLIALIMRVKAFLGRLVVIGRHHQHRIGPGLLGMLGKIDGLLGRIGTGAGHDRHPAPRLIDAPFHHLFVLVVGERRAFAGGADRHQAVGALGDLPIDQLTEGFLVDRAVLERGDERGE